MSMPWVANQTRWELIRLSSVMRIRIAWPRGGISMPRSFSVASE